MRNTRKSRRTFLKTLAIGGGCLTLGPALRAGARKTAKPSRPNFIFFFTDDQGWQDMACFGHPYLKTPHMDRLARGGARFEQFYSAASVCSPSRVGFMTGHYPARHRIHQHFVGTHKHNARRGMPDWLDPKVVTVTGLLQKAGYRTGHFGKWHLGESADAPEPGRYGIDEYRTLCGTGAGWDRDGKRAKSDLAHASYKTCTDKDYFWTHSSELIVEEGLAFIEKSKDQPFYLNLWMILPHAPNRPTAGQLAKYKDIKADPEDFQSWMREYLRKAPDARKQMKTYCAVMGAIDAALGRLLDKLDALGLADNTVILFTSDNGPEDYAISNASNSGCGATGVFRARKRSLYEGGIRMPCIVRWPGHVPAGRVDKTSVLAAVDWLPTVCNLAGVNVPDIRPDGEDVSDILAGKARPRRRPLFWEWRGGIAGVFREQYRPPRLAMRDGQWKLFADAEGTNVELYDIPRDPGEKANLAEQHPDVVARLLPKLLEWKKALPK